MPALPRYQAIPLNRRTSQAIDTAIEAVVSANSVQMTEIVTRATRAAADLSADLQGVGDTALRQSLRELGARR